GRNELTSLNLIRTLLALLQRLAVGVALAATICFSADSVTARATRIVVDEKRTHVNQGRAFGAAGPYERIVGRAFGENDPGDPRNAVITDIKLAPRNARGLVEYVATFSLWKPIDMSKASGTLIYAVPNRGNRLLMSAFNVGGDPGDDFFLKRGDIILYSGW